ncbi:MAG: AraC family transcriptional regulator, partial [Clostridia bacterium]|nr:AraC family transcriptional regulator [Clostridia bacterium]
LKSLHSHNYYEYFIILSGDITHEVNGETQHLKAGNLVLIRPNDYHRYIADSNSYCDIVNVSFTSEHFEKIKTYFEDEIIDALISSEMPPCITLNSQSLSFLRKKHNMLNLYSSKKNIATHLKSLLVDIFSYLIINYEQQSQNDFKKLLQPALLQMNTPENIEEGLPALLRCSGFSHGHLCRIMKKEFGTTPIKNITDLRLQYAANFLTTTDYDILSISMRLGFSSLSYFITIFKKKYGVPPSKYRSQHSNRSH